MNIQIIPMGKTAITHPNKAFSLAMQGQAEARKYQKAKRKHLPLPRKPK